MSVLNEYSNQMETTVYNIMKALFEAQSQNGEDGQQLVEDTIQALREFVINTFGQTGLDEEIERLARLLKNGVQ